MFDPNFKLRFKKQFYNSFIWYFLLLCFKKYKSLSFSFRDHLVVFLESFVRLKTPIIFPSTFIKFKISLIFIFKILK